MNRRVIQVIIAVVGLGVGLAIGVVITNLKSKPVIADLQSKLQQSEASSREKISNYGIITNRLNNELRRTNIELQQAKVELQQSKIELEKLKSLASAPAAEEAANTSEENKNTVAASDDSNAKLYTVKEGDSLWKIAARQLGDGNRYKEIIKLNPDVSPDGMNLDIGMKLKIPIR